MKLPTRWTDDILDLEAEFPPDIAPTPPRIYSLIFPPVGFFPFHEIGNGDSYGFYWPTGREDGPPIVAFMSHDVGSLIPEHSSIESFYACQTAKHGSDDDLATDYGDLVRRATGEIPVDHNLRDIASDDYDQLLTLDPLSPYYLCAAGDICLSRNDIDGAERYYRLSLEQLPEYVAAHFGLASVLRRLRRPEEASLHLRETLLALQAFYGGSFWADNSLPGTFRNDWNRKAFSWLKRTKTFHPSLMEDPFINHMDQLTFETGLAHNPDMDILEQLEEEYLQADAPAEAVRIWQLVGDRAAAETTSFRERYSLTPATYGTHLAELYDLAGNPLRAELVRNMLSHMEKPDGLYL